MLFPKARPCPCGKSPDSWWLHDAAGIPLKRVCYKCEDDARQRYNPAIFEPGSAYAATGEESDIDAERY